MTLPTRPLGSSGLDITTVGFGAWAIGGGGWAFGWGPQDDTDSLAAMHRALELGINWIDTAAVYGLGHSEELVGRLLRELPSRDRPLVFTKGGLVWDERGRGSRDSVVRRARHRRDRVQPDAGGPPDGQLHGGPCLRARSGRLAASRRGVPGAEPEPQSRTAGRAATDRAAARRHGLCHRR